MSNPARCGAFSQTQITRAIRAVRKAGQSVARTEIDRDGTIRIIHGNGSEEDVNPFDRWKSRHDARPT